MNLQCASDPQSGVTSNRSVPDVGGAIACHLPTGPTTSTHSDLPTCLEQVAHQLGAVYNRTPEQARFNLHADEFSVRSYLGTYLPRTVFEFMNIGDEMLCHAPIREVLPTDRPLRILDLGSGTGGAWMGLATALFANGFEQTLEVDAVDGNQLALSKQPPFAEALAAAAGVPIKLVTTHCQLGSDVETFASDLYAVLKHIDKCYDFVLVSKHLSEFYCAAGSAAYGVVFESLRWLEHAVTTNGFMVMLDLTTRIEEVGEFFPNLMAREMAHYLDQHPEGLRPVLPVPCAVSAQGGCAGSRGRCFTQRVLHFRHGMASSGCVRTETTKVAYRVLARHANASRITSGYSDDLPYHVNAQRDDQACHNGHIVFQPHGLNGYLPHANRTE